MSPRPSRRRVQLLGISSFVTAIAFAALVAAGSVAAHTGSPGSINVTPTTGLTVQASGTWTWPAMASASTLSYIGYAVDWGDVTTGNAIGTYHIGDGTAATNLVLQPTSPAQGSSGSFGPVSHTYALPGTYTVCVIIYDLGTSKPFTTVGYHSTQAGGSGRNTDNSVDHNQQVPVLCGRLDLTVQSPSASASVIPSASLSSDPSQTPFESFAGETSQPTPPSTGTADPAPGSDGGATPLLLTLLLGSTLSGLAIFKKAGLRR